MGLEGTTKYRGKRQRIGRDYKWPSLAKNSEVLSPVATDFVTGLSCRLHPKWTMNKRVNKMGFVQLGMLPSSGCVVYNRSFYFMSLRDDAMFIYFSTRVSRNDWLSVSVILNCACLQAQWKITVLPALNKFKVIGLEFEISTNQIKVQ
jgi:hypothetical protein